jgi:hypothetical protein
MPNHAAVMPNHAAVMPNHAAVMPNHTAVMKLSFFGVWLWPHGGLVRGQLLIGQVHQRLGLLQRALFQNSLFHPHKHTCDTRNAVEPPRPLLDGLIEPPRVCTSSAATLDVRFLEGGPRPACFIITWLLMYGTDVDEI